MKKKWGRRNFSKKRGEEFFSKKIKGVGGVDLFTFKIITFPFFNTYNTYIKWFSYLYVRLVLKKIKKGAKRVLEEIRGSKTFFSGLKRKTDKFLTNPGPSYSVNFDRSLKL